MKSYFPIFHAGRALHAVNAADRKVVKEMYKACKEYALYVGRLHRAIKEGRYPDDCPPRNRDEEAEWKKKAALARQSSLVPWPTA